jgi:hypothetical protein
MTASSERHCFQQMFANARQLGSFDPLHPVEPRVRFSLLGSGNFPCRTSSKDACVSYKGEFPKIGVVQKPRFLGNNTDPERGCPER